MKNHRFIFSLALTGMLLVAFIPTKADSRKEFIRKYRQLAIREMERTGIPASIILAQGILESGCGRSELAVNANNHFGIKCHEWTGETYAMDDDEGKECFRKYKTPEQSWTDHSEFLSSRPRYAGLFRLKTTDYKGWAKGLKAAGYATNPKYAELLIRIIEEEKLYKYDRNIVPAGEGTADVTDGAVAAETAPSPQTPHSPNYRNREEMRNGLICISTVPGDTFDRIAAYYGIRLKKLLQYNDRTSPDLKAGQVVYLERKKTKAARGYEFHRVKKGERPHDIAQKYGIRLKNLLRYNYLSADDPLMEGEKLFLRKKADLL